MSAAFESQQSRSRMRRGVFRGLIALAGCLAFGLASCGGDPAEKAMAEIASGGFAFSIDDFHRASAAGEVRMVSAFLAAGMEAGVAALDGGTAVGAAARNGRPEVLAVLLAAGAGVDVIQPGGRTPLMLAAENGHTQTVQILLDHGASREAVDPDGWSPLALAVWHGHAGAVESLADGASPEALDTALLLAAMTGDPALCEVLLRGGASIMAVDAEGRGALMLAARHGHPEVARLLVERGANRFEVHAFSGMTPAQMADEGARKAVAANDPELAERCRAAGDILRRPPPADEIEAVGIFSDPRDAVAPGDGVDPLIEDAAAQGRVRLATPLHGWRTSGALAADAPPPSGLEYVEYRMRPLPFVLESVATDHSTATFRLLFGNHGVVVASRGERIENTGWVLMDCRHQTAIAKDGEEMRETSTAELGRPPNPSALTLHAGQPALAEAPSAVLFDRRDNRLLLGRAGDQFHASHLGTDVVLREISPELLVFSDLESTRTWTLPRTRLIRANP